MTHTTQAPTHVVYYRVSDRYGVSVIPFNHPFFAEGGLAANGCRSWIRVKLVHHEEVVAFDDDGRPRRGHFVPDDTADEVFLIATSDGAEPAYRAGRFFLQEESA